MIKILVLTIVGVPSQERMYIENNFIWSCSIIKLDKEDLVTYKKIDIEKRSIQCKNNMSESYESPLGEEWEAFPPISFPTITDIKIQPIEGFEDRKKLTSYTENNQVYEEISFGPLQYATEQQVNCIPGLSYEYKGNTNFIFERISNFRGFVTHKKAIVEEIGVDDLLMIDRIKSHFKNE